MSRQVVEHHDVAAVKFGTKHLLQIGGEDFGINRAFDQKGCGDTLSPQRGNESGALPVAMRHAGKTTKVRRTAAVAAGHLRVQAGLVDEDQPVTVPLGLRLPPEEPGGFDVRSFLFGGVRRFFYSSNPVDPAGAIRR